MFGRRRATRKSRATYMGRLAGRGRVAIFTAAGGGNRIWCGRAKAKETHGHSWTRVGGAFTAVGNRFGRVRSGATTNRGTAPADRNGGETGPAHGHRSG